MEVDRTVADAAAAEVGDERLAELVQQRTAEQDRDAARPGVRVDLGDKGVWYRVQGVPLDEKQAQNVCSTLKTRKADCVLVPPAR